MSMLQPQQDDLDWSAARLDEQRLTNHRLPAVSQASAADSQIAAGVSSLQFAMHTGVSQLGANAMYHIVVLLRQHTLQAQTALLVERRDSACRS